MSQFPPSYPPPYPPQPPYSMPYGMPDEYLGPARRAGALMYVIAALTLLMAFCCAGVGAGLPRLIAERPDLFSEMRTIPEATPELLRTLFFVGAGIALVAAIVLAVLAHFVRRGSKAAIIVSLIISGLAMLYFLFSAASVFLRGGAGGGSALAGAMCSTVVPLALFALLLAWLIQALQSGGSGQAIQQQYAQQYWQHLWQQQMYNQTPPGQQPPPGMPPPGVQPPGMQPPPQGTQPPTAENPRWNPPPNPPDQT